MSSVALIGVGITAGVSATAAILAVIITYVLTKRREHEADWRKMKFGQYQEFILALSGVVRERATPDGQRRYADAVNSMFLVAPPHVLDALVAFQNKKSFRNQARDDQRHDELFNALLGLLRDDVHSRGLSRIPTQAFKLFGIPPPDAS